MATLAGCMYPSSSWLIEGLIGRRRLSLTHMDNTNHVVQAARQKRGEIIKRAEKYVKEYKKVS